MIVHVLRFSFKEGTSDDELAAIEAALKRLASSEAASFSVVGQDLGTPDYTLAYCVAFEDLAALERYMLHEPTHIAADRAILPHVANLAAVDLSDDRDPELGAKIAALHQHRLATDPEFAELLRSVEGEFAVDAQ
jgi:Stress responsive A/B Barrel Domain